MNKYELGSGNNISFTRLNKQKYGKCSKILITFDFLFTNKILVIRT